MDPNIEKVIKAAGMSTLLLATHHKRHVEMLTHSFAFFN